MPQIPSKHVIGLMLKGAAAQAADVLQLKDALPSPASTRLVVRRVVKEVERRLAEPLRQAVAGALNRSRRNPRPMHQEMVGTGRSWQT